MGEPNMTTRQVFEETKRRIWVFKACKRDVSMPWRTSWGIGQAKAGFELAAQQLLEWVED